MMLRDLRSNLERAASAAVLVLGLVVCGGLLACASSKDDEAFQQDQPLPYNHSFELMWDQVQEALKRQYTIESADEATRTVTTEWDVHLAPFSHGGYRTRLIVKLDGEIGAWNLNVKEENQTNTELEDPLSPEEADWEDSGSEGGSAQRFLVSLHRLLNPRRDFLEERR